MKFYIALIFFAGILIAQEGKKVETIAVNETFLPLITTQDSLQSIEYLKRDIDFIINRNSYANTQYSIAVYSLDRREYLYTKNEERGLTPASLTKLFTTFTSLSNMGDSSFVRTSIFCLDDNINDGEINSDLFIQGHGDALFDVGDLDTLFKLIKNKGISKIDGNILIDQSFFDNINDRKAYSGDRDRVQNLAPITPFSVSRRPSLRASKYIRNVLTKNSISFPGEISTCELPDFADNIEIKLLAEFRRPLVDLIKITNKRSDNFVAEHLFKMNGAINNFSDIDAYSSQDLLLKTTSDFHIDFNDCVLNDGSGLSRRNKLTAKSIVDLLIKVDMLPYAPNYRSSLAIAGYDGTLKGRLKGTLAEKNLIGKTGTLRDASGLAGYVNTLDGERLAFAIIFNGNSGVRYYKQLEDELVQNLAGFFYFNVAN